VQKEPLRFGVVMKPRPQLNCVLALGCLGYYVQVMDRKHGRVLGAGDLWPDAPPLSLKKKPPAQTYQFQTVWHGGKFWHSYYNLVARRFEWVQRGGPFRSAVQALKRGRRLRLQPLTVAHADRLPKDTPVYVEHARPAANGQSATVCFFGIARDLVAKYSLLPRNSPGRQAMQSAGVYFVPPSARTKLVAALNARGVQALPKLTVQHVAKFPEQGLKNLAGLWSDETADALYDRLAVEPNFFRHVMDRVPRRVHLHAMKCDDCETEELCSVIDGGLANRCLRLVLALALSPNSVTL